MLEHPILNAIRNAGFTPLGWFVPTPADGVPPLTTGAQASFIILIGNAGPRMFRRFMYDRHAADGELDSWCRAMLGELAIELDADVLFPFDKPPLPFLTWARRSGQSHVSPLGLNIHPTYGLWHAYRGAFTFPVVFDIPSITAASPCESCVEKPCLSACPVNAFTPGTYDIEACVGHIAGSHGTDCMGGGCLARRACPIGRQFTYGEDQAQFHMRAFLDSRHPAGKTAQSTSGRPP